VCSGVRYNLNCFTSEFTRLCSQHAAQYILTEIENSWQLYLYYHYGCNVSSNAGKLLCRRYRSDVVAHVDQVLLL